SKKILINVDPRSGGDFFCLFMKEQLLLAWDIHNQKNLLLLSQLSATELNTSSTSRSRTVAEQLAHVHNVRLQWVESVAKAAYQKSMLLPKDTALTSTVLKEAFQNSAGIIRQVIEQSWEAGGKLPSFKTGLISFISYLVSHESHHRGNILLTLKQSGYKIPDSLKWGLWEWSVLPKQAL
ncbi:MAG: DinB family protein, partial [Bacteroidota bacterium]|nr:DinB family protein [Bacteroidota bacterium]